MTKSAVEYAIRCARQAQKRQRQIAATPKPPVGRIGQLAAPAKGRPGRHDLFHVVDRFDVSSSRARAACDHRLELEGSAVENVGDVPRHQRCSRVGCAAFWPAFSRAVLSNYRPGRAARGRRDELVRVGPFKMRACCGSSHDAPHLKGCGTARVGAKASTSISKRIAHAGAITLQRKLVCCGKGNCRMCGGRVMQHGPYWYAFWKAHGKTRCRYVGRNLPEEMKSDPRFHVDEHILQIEAST